MYKVFIAIGIVAAACLIAGCGSGEDEATSADATTPLTKAQFIKQADAICTDVAQEREAEIAAWKKEYPGGAAEAEENFDDGLQKVIVPSMRSEIKALEALAAPADDEEVVARLIANLEGIRSAIAEQGSDGISKAGVPKYEREAAAYGLKACRYP